MFRMLRRWLDREAEIRRLRQEAKMYAVVGKLKEEIAQFHGEAVVVRKYKFVHERWLEQLEEATVAIEDGDYESALRTVRGACSDIEHEIGTLRGFKSHHQC